MISRLFFIALLFVATSSYAQNVVAKRTIELNGELSEKGNIFLVIDGTEKTSNKPKFIARMAIGNNIVDYTINDVQDTYIFSNDVEAEKHRNRINHLVFSPAKSHLISVDDENIKVWSTITKKLAYTIPDKSKPYVFASSDYKLAYTSFKKSGDNDNKIYDYVNKKNSSFKTTEGLYSGMRMSADGKYILAYDTAPMGTGAGELTVWDANTGKIMFTRVCRANDAQFTPDSKYVIALWGKTMYKFGVDGKEVFKTEMPELFFKITVSDDGKYVYANTTFNFELVDAETGKMEKRLPYKFPAFIKQCIFTEDGLFALLIEREYKSTQMTLSVVEINW